MIRQATMMRYGVRWQSGTFKYSLGSRRPNRAARVMIFGLNFAACFQPGARSNDDVVTFVQVAGTDFDRAGRSRCLAEPEQSESCRTDCTTKTLRGSSRAVNRFHRHREYVFRCSVVRSTSAYMPGTSSERRVGNVDFRLHGSGGLIDLICEAGDAARKRAIQRGHSDVHRLAQMNQRNRGFRHRQRQPKQAVLRKPDHRHSLGLRSGSRLNQ